MVSTTGMVKVRIAFCPPESVTVTVSDVVWPMYLLRLNAVNTLPVPVATSKPAMSRTDRPQPEASSTQDMSRSMEGVATAYGTGLRTKMLGIASSVTDLDALAVPPNASTAVTTSWYVPRVTPARLTVAAQPGEGNLPPVAVWENANAIVLPATVPVTEVISYVDWAVATTGMVVSTFAESTGVTIVTVVAADALAAIPAQRANTKKRNEKLRSKRDTQGRRFIEQPSSEREL